MVSPVEYFSSGTPFVLDPVPSTGFPFYIDRRFALKCANYRGIERCRPWLFEALLVLEDEVRLPFCIVVFRHDLTYRPIICLSTSVHRCSQGPGRSAPRRYMACFRVYPVSIDSESCRELVFSGDRTNSNVIISCYITPHFV